MDQVCKYIIKEYIPVEFRAVSPGEKLKFLRERRQKRVMAAKATRYGHLSGEEGYVFDGEKNTPYLPTDKTNPINAYGLTKLHGEEAVKQNCDRYYILRTSWLYGHHGKNFVETMISLAEKDEVKVVDDQIGCPTWTVDLADAIISFIDEDPDYGIYHACGSGSTTWYGFAKEIYQQMGLNVNLNPCTTKEFPRPAKRPKYSIMNNEGLLRDWKLALHEYLELRIED